MKQYAEKFYKSQAWKKTREAYLKSVGFLCEECLKQGTYTPATEVHHVEPISPSNINNTNITLNWSNLRALCHQCHMNQHKKEQSRRFSVDDFGRISPLIEKNDPTHKGPVGELEKD